LQLSLLNVGSIEKRATASTDWWLDIPLIAQLLAAAHSPEVDQGCYAARAMASLQVCGVSVDDWRSALSSWQLYVSISFTSASPQLQFSFTLASSSSTAASVG
jgi:hypothetical protein